MKFRFDSKVGKHYGWRYDTRLYSTKKEALEKIGDKYSWNDCQKYYAAKRSINKEYLYY